MIRLLKVIGNAQWRKYEGTAEEMAGIRSGVDNYIRQMRMAGQAGVEISTEMAVGNVLLVKKYGRAFITVQFV